MSELHQVIQRAGHDLLYMPQCWRCALETVRLYPAQRKLARASRALLRAALRTRIPLPLTKGAPPAVEWQSVEWCGDDPDLRCPAAVGVLAGNPHAEGRRYTYLAFDENAKALYIAKIGFSDAARKRIRRERDFLRLHADRVDGIPKVFGSLETLSHSGFIIPYFKGRTPDWHADVNDLDRVLLPWVDTTRKVPLAAIPAWASLSGIDACAAISDQEVHPVIHHGDFAPWNMLVESDGRWRVMDWERGDAEGVPGWDWFHYVIQPALLVDRVTPAVVRQRIDTCLTSARFVAYAQQTRIVGSEEALLHGYLHYSLALLADNKEGADATCLRAGLHALLS